MKESSITSLFQVQQISAHQLRPFRKAFLRPKGRQLPAGKAESASLTA